MANNEESSLIGDSDSRRVDHLAPMALWPQNLIYGTLLGGLLVGIWEWEDLTLRHRWPTASRVMLTAGVPVALVIVNRWGPMDVPYGVFVVALMSMWYLVPRSFWNPVGSTAVLMATTVQSVVAFGWSRRTGLDLLMIVGLSLVLLISTRLRTDFHSSVVLYTGISGAALVYMIINHDPGQDLLISLTVASVTAAYIVGRANRNHRWDLDIYRAEHDALTGALTRHGLNTWLHQRSAEARSSGLIVACDLDDFKWFNDTWGHDLGDQVLQAFAHRLQTELRDQDALIRPGGDEFTVWMPGVSAEHAPPLVQRLHRAVTAPTYSLTTGPFHLGVSIGWAAGALSEDTAQAADQSLLQAKRQGKNRVAQAHEDHPTSSGTPKSFTQLGWLGDAARTLWAHWPTGAVLTNTAGRIVAVNPAYEQLTGRSWAELADQKPGVNSAEETSPEVYQALWHTLQEGTAWQGSLKNRRPDGTTWWAQEVIIPIYVGNQVVGYWGNIRERHSHDDLPMATRTATPGDTQGRQFLQDLTFAVVFQPIVDLRTELVLGHEALIRPQRQGLAVTPLDMFAEAVTAGIDAQADQACLQAVCRALGTMGTWPPGQKLFVNMRSTTLKDPSTFHQSLQSLAAVVPWDQLVVEVSEQGTTAIHDWEAWARLYPHVVFAQDDVGVGEADLARLVRLRPTWVKIDISLIARIVDDQTSRKLVGALTEWTHGMGAYIIAEGVETVAQAGILRQFGVDAGQGYLWAHATPNLETRIPRFLPS